WRSGSGPTRCRSWRRAWTARAAPRRPWAWSEPGTGSRTIATAWRRRGRALRPCRPPAGRCAGRCACSCLLDVGDEHAGHVEVADRGGAADDVAGDLEGVLQRRCRGEAEPAHGRRVAADDDHLAGPLLAVGTPVPGVERMDAVIGVAGPVQVPVPLV